MIVIESCLDGFQLLPIPADAEARRGGAVAKGPRIFLAHASEDEAHVCKLYHELKDLGFHPWVGKKNLLPGQQWRLEIPKAVQRCDFFIACLSKYSIFTKGYVRNGFRIALDAYAQKAFTGSYFIPLKFDNCDLPAVRFPQFAVSLRDFQWIDYWAPDGLVQLINVIANKQEHDNGLFRRILVNSLGMKFTYIPPGAFMMGSPAAKEDDYDDETQHKVILTQGFYLQTTQVTQGQWQKVTKCKPSHFKSFRKDRPVENISWNDVQKFIHKLNQREKVFRYRLPSEAEWEYAARAGSSTRFCFGDSYEQLKEYAWFYDNSSGATHPVAKKTPNKWGLFDMYGNVWEWCQDCYGPYERPEVIDPRGLSSGPARVIRGGSWSSIAEFCRSASRDGFVPGSRNDGLGFRLVRMKI